MKNANTVLSMITFTMLNSSCGNSLKGEWDGKEMYVVVDGEVESTQNIPYEECYPYIDPETGEADQDQVTCIDRGFVITIEDRYTGFLEATNGETEGYIVPLSIEDLSQDYYLFSKGIDFMFVCVSDETEIDCDFTETGGYLRNYHMLFKLRDED